MQKTSIFKIILLGLFFLSNLYLNSQTGDKRIIANPLNLNYRFQLDGESRREAADPVIEYFKGKYYLFASKSGGYWSSPDLVEWTFVPIKTISTIEHYAPTVLIMDDTMYFMSSLNV